MGGVKRDKHSTPFARAASQVQVLVEYHWTDVRYAT